MLHSMRNWIRNKYIRIVLIAAAYLLLWQLAAAVVGSPLLLPGPVTTIRRLFELLKQPVCWGAIALTLGRILAGFLLGVLLGVLLGALTAASKLADALLAPLRSIVKATPVTSFILLALLWFSATIVPVWISFLMVLPIVWSNVAEALLGTDPQLMEMSRVFRFTWWQRVREIYLPSVARPFFAACTTALGFAWKSGVAAEILSLPRHAVGTYLYQAKLTLETADLFAWTLCVIAFSMLMERAMIKALRRLSHD